MAYQSTGGRSIVAVAVACEGLLGVIALGVGWFLERPPLDQIAWTASAVGYGLAATVPMLLALWVMTRWPVGPLGPLADLVRQLVVPLFRDCKLVDLLLIAALAGVGEELLFRGVAQAGVEQFTGSQWLAIAIAALLFGAAHPISTTYALLAGLIGVYFGWLLMATDNLLVPIVAHGAYDFVALVYLLQRGDQIRPPSNGVGGSDVAPEDRHDTDTE